MTTKLDFQPKAFDVIIERQDDGAWTAKYYNTGTQPKLIQRGAQRADVRGHAMQFAKMRGTRVVTRTLGGNLVMNDKDNIHLIGVANATTGV